MIQWSKALWSAITVGTDTGGQGAAGVPLASPRPPGAGFGIPLERNRSSGGAGPSGPCAPISWFLIDVARWPVRSCNPYGDFAGAVAKKGPRWRIYVECCASLHSGFAQSIAVLAVRVRSITLRASTFLLDGLFSLRAPRTPRVRRRESLKGMFSRDAVRVRLRVGGG